MGITYSSCLLVVSPVSQWENSTSWLLKILTFQFNNAKLFKKEQLEEAHAKQLESLKMVHDQEKAQLLDEFESKVNEFNNEGTFMSQL